jgi:hypothetical protein
MVLALWMFPYVWLGVMIRWLLGGPHPGDLLYVSGFALVALGETMYLILWLRRPVKRSGAR